MNCEALCEFHVAVLSATLRSDCRFAVGMDVSFVPASSLTPKSVHRLGKTKEIHTFSGLLNSNEKKGC